MDEQNDQAVLELEEIETGTDYDYLSILREMQESLSGDEEFADNLNLKAEEINVPAELAAKKAAPMSSDSNSDSHLTLIEGESNSAQTADYFADAPTQPLPELPAEFINHSLTSESSATAAEAETHSETETGSSNNSVISNKDSFSLAIDSLETAGHSSVQESVEKSTNANEIGEPSFDDFAELSPILFDADEAAGITEPDFDSELSVESPTELKSFETTADDSPADFSQATQTADSETALNNLPLTADEMPMSLAFSEIFGTDSNESNTAFEPPPVEFDEEDEFKTAPLLQHLESEDNNLSKGLSEFAAPNFESYLPEQNSSEQYLATESSANSNEFATEQNLDKNPGENLDDLGLPESMFLSEAESNFTFAPPLTLSNSKSEEKGDSESEMTEPDLSEPQTEESETGSLGLSVPWFLQEELTAKKSASEESFPEPFFAEDSFAGEATAQPELNTEPPAITVAASITENNNEARPATNAALHDETDGKNGFEGDFSLQEAEAVTSETVSFESSAADYAEIQYPEDLPENFLATPLENEFNEFAELPDNISDEATEALFLKNSETQTPESGSVGFAAPPEPQFENVNSAVSEPQTNSALMIESPEHDAATQSSFQEKYYQPGKASFLEERFVIFKLDDTLYALPAVNVAEIGQLLPITPLPFVPSWFLGITHLRGDIVSVVGLRELWQKNTAVPYKAKILIVHSEKQSLTIALVVDAVREMRHVKPAEITSGESQHGSHFAPYQIGTVDYDGQNLCLLNAEKLLETLRK